MSYNYESRRLKAEDTKQKIYRSAVKLFSSYAYHSVDEIVKLAGFAKGSFYVHFDSKDALITSLINDKVQLSMWGIKIFLMLFRKMPAQELLLSFIGKIADVLVDQLALRICKLYHKAQITHDFNTKDVNRYNRDIIKCFMTSWNGASRGRNSNPICL